MWTAQGPMWRDGAFVDGWVTVASGRITATGDGDAPGDVDAMGVLVPSLVNAHTHVGDFLARGRIPPDATLEEVVAPPNGIKHRVLRAATAAELQASIRGACVEAYEAGTRVLYDFREGGRTGARQLRIASQGSGVTPVILGRPAAGGVGDAGEMPEVLDAADGLGLSALRDVDTETAHAYRDAARGAGKRFALHWSEAEREPVDAALDLAPDFLVHAVHATPDDVARVADADVPVVVCPRSNARLVGTLPDVPGLLDAGVDVCVGTDNAMLQSVSVLDELRFLRERFPDVPPAALVAMAVDAPRKRLSPPNAMRRWDTGEPADFTVLAWDGGDPFEAVLGADARVAAHPRVTDT